MRERSGASMARFHFVEDYERLVASLVATYPLDEAMSLAVGGLYEEVGLRELNIVRYAGLRDGMAIIDLGCGSGRLAAALGRTMKISYFGIDIVSQLLEYAKSKSPPDYVFMLNHALKIPAASATADMVVAFSLFTHLLHAESYIYLEEMRRVLKPGGKAVFSFLEFATPGHWQVFADTVNAQRADSAPHLNMFIERGAISVWAERLGFEAQQFVGATEAPWGGAPLGQSMVILQKPL